MCCCAGIGKGLNVAFCNPNVSIATKVLSFIPVAGLVMSFINSSHAFFCCCVTSPLASLKERVKVLNEALEKNEKDHRYNIEHGDDKATNERLVAEAGKIKADLDPLQKELGNEQFNEFSRSMYGLMSIIVTSIAISVATVALGIFTGPLAIALLAVRLGLLAGIVCHAVNVVKVTNQTQELMDMGAKKPAWFS